MRKGRKSKYVPSYEEATIIINENNKAEVTTEYQDNISLFRTLNDKDIEHMRNAFKNNSVSIKDFFDIGDTVDSNGGNTNDPIINIINNVKKNAELQTNKYGGQTSVKFNSKYFISPTLKKGCRIIQEQIYKEENNTKVPVTITDFYIPITLDGLEFVLSKAGVDTDIMDVIDKISLNALPYYSITNGEPKSGIYGSTEKSGKVFGNFLFSGAVAFPPSAGKDFQKTIQGKDFSYLLYNWKPIVKEAENMKNGDKKNTGKTMLAGL